MQSQVKSSRSYCKCKLCILKTHCVSQLSLKIRLVSWFRALSIIYIYIYIYMWSYVWRAREDYHNFSVHYCVPQLCTMVPYAQNHEQFLHITTGSGLCLIFCVLHLFKLRPVCFVSVRDSFFLCFSLCIYCATRMQSADYAVARCLSVCLSHAGIVPKRLHISSIFFHIRVAPPF